MKRSLSVLRKFFPAFLTLSVVAAFLLILSIVQSFRTAGGGKTVLFRGEYGSAVYDDSGSSLAVAAPGQLSLLSSYGKVLSSVPADYKNPACSAQEKLSVFYDVGKPGFRVIYPDGSVFNAETEKPVSYACANKNGTVCVIYSTGASNGTVLVYDSDLTALFCLEVTRAVPLYAAVSDGDIFCLGSTAGSGGRLHFFRLNSTEEIGRFEVDDDAILHMQFIDSDTLIVLTPHRLFYVESDGRALDELTFGKRVPVAIAASSELVAVATSASGGSPSSVTVLDSIGNILSAGEFEQSVRAMSVSSKNLLIMFERESTLYSSLLEEKVSYQQPASVKQIFLRPDNKAVFAGSEGADLIDFGRR